VVHTIGGAISLAGAIALGPRLGRVFRRDGGGPMPPHNLLLGAVGGLILWFGWYGFNPGSTLSALDAQGIGRVSFNTTLAACSAGLLALFYSYARSFKWDLGLTVNGFLAGLVAITCPCYWVDPVGAFLIGLIGAGAMIVGLEVLEYLRIDDPIGAVPVHMFAGIAGTLSLGLFGAAKYGLPGPGGADATTTIDGLFYGGGGHLLWVQTYGVASVAGATLAVSFVLMYAVKFVGALRVSEVGEREGLDLHEHGAAAYPEFVLNRGLGGYAQPVPVEAPATAALPRVVAPRIGARGTAE
jgi:Amt family ammonium transporter